MEFQVLPFIRTEHYEMVGSWWKKQGWPVIPLECLPYFGFVVTHEGVPHCAGWLYSTDSAFMVLEWIVGNPETDTIKRSRAIDKLIESAITIAKSQGAKIIFSSLRHRGLIAKYKRHGFTVSDQGMTNVVWMEKEK